MALSNANISPAPPLTFTVQEVQEVSRDLDRIGVSGFADAYDTFKKALPEMLKEKQFYNHHGLFRVSGIGETVQGEVYIAKKMRCKGVEGNNHFRVVFQIDGQLIRIIEVFHKGQKENGDIPRIRKYCCP